MTNRQTQARKRTERIRRHQASRGLSRSRRRIILNLIERSRRLVEAMNLRWPERVEAGDRTFYANDGKLHQWDGSELNTPPGTPVPHFVPQHSGRSGVNP